MNRAQRRAAKKRRQEQVYNVKPSDLSEIKSKATVEAIDAAMILLFSIPIKVMHDKYGWGEKKRLPEFGEALIDEYQAFDEGDMSLQEYQDMVYEMCGIKFAKNEGDQH